MKMKNLMPVAYLEDLKIWITNSHWHLEETVAKNEVLRARNKGKGIFILLETANPDFYCITEHHGKDIRKYLQSVK